MSYKQENILDYELRKKNKGPLAIVKQMVADGQVAQNVAEKYFPELKESEDEKIRKHLISFRVNKCSIKRVLRIHKRKLIMKLIDKDALVAEIKKCYNECLKRAKITDYDYWSSKADAYRNVLVILDDTLEVKEVDLMIHTIIAECCDWLAMNTNLSHDEIESCRNMMLTVKEEQFKAHKGEKI